MSSWKIYSYPNNPRVWKALIAAKYVGISIETPPFQIGVDNKTPEFLSKNPVGKVPVLETPEGCVWESNAIARHVARQSGSKIYGSTAYETALIDQWLDFAVNEIELASAAWLFPILGLVPYHREATNKAKGDIKKAMEILNAHLLSHTFLVGERISLADIVVSMVLYRLYKMVFDPKYRKGFGNVTRWYLTVVNQPEFKAVIGEVELATKMLEAQPAAEAPQASKPKEAPSAKPAAEGASEEKPQPKKVNPLDALPASKFILDDWKRKYSNTKNIRDEAMPWFWENFDAEGWSLWWSDYKDNDQNQIMFKTCNLIGGFIQGLDRVRKYAFGSMLIFGEEPRLEVTGCWLFRGQEVPAEIVELGDFDSYTWTKITNLDDATRKLVDDYFCWSGDFGGRKFADQGKIFK